MLLSWAHACGQLVKVRCGYCCEPRYYLPEDLQRLFGDVDVYALPRKMRCERCGRRDNMDVDVRQPSAEERQRITIRRLQEIRLRRIPLWRDEPP